MILDEILAWRSTHGDTPQPALHYDLMMLRLDPTPLARGCGAKRV